jgi:hypothetical protein
MLSGTVIRSAKPTEKSDNLMDGAGIHNPRIAFESYKYTHVHHRIHRHTFAPWNAAETGKSCPLGSFQLTSGPVGSMDIRPFLYDKGHAS